MEISHVDQDQDCCFRPRRPHRHRHYRSSTQQAQAKGLGLGIAAGVIGAAVVGSAIAANETGYGYGYRRCGWVRQYDGYGNYVGRVRTCNY
jgi:hypothetical protein